MVERALLLFVLAGAAFKQGVPENVFELYATGIHSLASLRRFLKTEYGKVFTKWYLAKLMKNPFYIGSYQWEGKTYAGTHLPLVSPEIFSRVREVLSSKAHLTSKNTSLLFPVCSAVHTTIAR
jgi:hypothetical protein